MPSLGAPAGATQCAAQGIIAAKHRPACEELLALPKSALSSPYPEYIQTMAREYDRKNPAFATADGRERKP